MDNTLIDSNNANNLAYQNAIAYYLPNYSLPKQQRITASTIRSVFPDLSSQIIAYKQENFNQFLKYTSVNKNLIDFIHFHFPNKTIYLVSKSQANRANAILAYHQLDSLIQQKFFYPNISYKYPFIIKKLNLNINHLIIFDDDINQLHHAEEIGISTAQLFHVTL